MTCICNHIRIQSPRHKPAPSSHVAPNAIVFCKDQERHLVSHEQAGDTAQELQAQESQRQAIFTHRTKPHQPEVDERQVRRFRDLIRRRVPLNVQELETVEHFQDAREPGRWRTRPDRVARFEEAGAGTEARKAVAGAIDQAEELRSRVKEVGDLRNEE